MANKPINDAVSVIIPALDEGASIAGLIEALLNGTRVPDEIVIADGGSTDRTREIAESFADGGVRVIEGPGGISENRNAAIDAAVNPIIACTDAGCIPDPTWLELITEPFSEGASWVGGLSRPARRSRSQALTGLSMMPAPSEVDINHFVPGGASQAFVKTAWERVGGFPEGMTAGEDTLFGQQLRRAGYEPVVVTEAQVAWQSPGSVREMAQKSFTWGRADGSAGTSARAYARMLSVWGTGAFASLAFALARRPRLAVASVAAMLTASAWKTRRKHAYLDDPVASVVLPAVHATAVTSQGLGWITGFLNQDDGTTVVDIGRTVRAEATVRAKRAIRPYVPESLMKRVRNIDQRAQSRNNVDVLVSATDDIQRWLDATPDTYRVGVELVPDQDGEAEMVDRIDVDVWPATIDGAVTERLIGAMDGREAAVLAATEPPRIDRTRVNEPHVDPIAVVARRGLLARLAPDDASTAHHLVRQAGLHQALIPAAGFEPRPSQRPIVGAGAVVILGSVPMYDVGGGSRGAQMAHELVARGYHVTYLNLFPSDEALDLGLRYLHPNLETLEADLFDVDLYLSRVKTADRVGILEIPHLGYNVTIAALRTAGFRVAYDLIDDWSDAALGGWGYRVDFERELGLLCDGLIASAPSLLARLQEMSGRDVTLVPNAVNTRLFSPGEHPMPDDVPEGDGPLLEYHGSLYGDWFDWAALERTAEQHPDARLLIIGDDRNRPDMPENVHFVGLKPQHQLPAYLAHTDVAIIPFEVSETTHAVSPLKVFEYLAMGVRVASTPLDPVVGLRGVTTDIDLSVAVSKALEADVPDAQRAAGDHSWENRMELVFASLGLTLTQEAGAAGIEITQHSTQHWDEVARRL